MYTVLYHTAVVKNDIPLLDSRWRVAVKSAIEEKLTSIPDTYGIPLRGTLARLWKLRIGDYRVVYEISGKNVTIYAIMHRSRMYKEVPKRR